MKKDKFCGLAQNSAARGKLWALVIRPTVMYYGTQSFAVGRPKPEITSQCVLEWSQSTPSFCTKSD